MTLKNKLLIGLVIIIMILAITNPTQTDFEKYLQVKVGRSVENEAGRTGYYLIFSVYEYNYIAYPTIRYLNPKDEISVHYKYIGVFKNFFLLSK